VTDAARAYLELAGGGPLRAEAFLDQVGPDLSAERERTLADKEGLELEQGRLLAEVLANPVAGAQLVDSMLRPTPEALERLDDFRATGVADLGAAHLRREGRAGVLELRNPRHLNAEDDGTLPATEVAVDLALLDPEIEIGVFRGGVVEHPRYAGRRIFGAGINLTLLYRGRVSYGFYMVRDLGYVNKLYRGLSGPEPVEKLWLAAVETYAIGGACQLLHVMDHVIAERGARLFLPARKEGIIPGASNLRLPRAVGARLARQAILSGREFVAGTPAGDLLVDETVEPGEMDAAIGARVEALTSSGLVNAAANRRALRVGEEPLEVFREYMAVYAREQAVCHLSPALVENLERNWNAKERRV
jgi:thioesterase DpgC